MKTLQDKAFWRLKRAVLENQLRDAVNRTKKVLKKRSPPSMGVKYREKSSSETNIPT